SAGSTGGTLVACPRPRQAGRRCTPRPGGPGTRIGSMRRESSTVVVLVGEVGEGLLDGLGRSPNVSVARVRAAGGGPAGGTHGAAQVGGGRAGHAGGGPAPVDLRDRAR